MITAYYLGLLVFALNGLIFLAIRRETVRQEEKLRKITRLLLLSGARGLPRRNR